MQMEHKGNGERLILIGPHQHVDCVAIAGELFLVSVSEPRCAFGDLDRSVGIDDHSLNCV